MLMIRKSLLRLYYALKKESEVDYNGEFGYELISVIPFAYWLHKKGKLSKSISCTDTKAFYYFSKQHEEAHSSREYVIPKTFPINNIHRRFLNTFMMWSPPPYKKHYQNDIFIFDKPICIICNKYNSEWGFPPISFLSKDVLASLFQKLLPHYTIIYCRPYQKEIVKDNSKVYDLEEHDWISKTYPEVKLIQDLHKQYPKYSFNELQLNCFANASRFISTQGGYAILCSYFKGINIIYGAKTAHKTAIEITYNCFKRWYHRFSGATIHYSDTYKDLENKVSKYFINTKTNNQH